MALPTAVIAIIEGFEIRALQQLVTQFAIGLGAGLAANVLSDGSQDLSGCLSRLEKILSEIDATLKDGFSGRNVDVGGRRRELERDVERLRALARKAEIEAELDDLNEVFPQFLRAERRLKEFNQQHGSPTGQTQTPVQIDPAALNELNALIKDLATAIGGEEGLLAAFLELDAALQGANLPAELENLADAVATAAARIDNASPGGTTNGKASGGTVQPGQPVLVGERGPEIFVPSTAGAIVNAFDASADPSALGAGGSSGQIVRALQNLEETISELDETIQEAEGASLNGVGGGSSRGRSFRSRRGGTSALDEVEDFLATVESTVDAFENIGRTMEKFRDRSKEQFGDISAAGQQAFQSILGSIQTLATNFIGGKAGRIVGVIASFARIFGFGFAGGGDLQPGVPVLVGERGPEVIVPRVPLSVKNNADTRRLLGGGTPIVVNQTVNMSPDVKNTIRAEVLNAMPIAAQLATQAVTASLQGRRF